MERNKLLVSLGIAVFLLAGIGLFFYFLFPASENDTQDITKNAPVVKKEPSTTQETYVDDAGFQFEYPDDTTVTKKDTLDETTYADVSVRSSVVPGSIQFTAQDSKIKSLTAWLAENKITSTSAKIQTTTLGNIDALDIETADKKITVALDKGVLFLLESIFSADKEYWQSVYKTVQSSFSFVSLSPATANQAPAVESSGGEVELEEEIIE